MHRSVPPRDPRGQRKSEADNDQVARDDPERLFHDLQAVRSGSALPSAADVELAANPQTFLQASPPTASSQAAAPFATTRLIHAPQFVDEPWLLPDEQCPEPVSTWWSRLRDRWSNWLWSRTPEWVVQLQSTQQQVGGAVADYERRRDQLRELVREANDVLTELRAALAQRPEDDDLLKAAEEQEEQRGQMQLRLSQVEARLAQLCHQRDLLQARLKAAHAKLHIAGQKPPRVRRRRTLVAGGLLLLVVFGVLAVFRSPQQKGGAKVTVEATPDIPLPTEILKAARVTIDMHSNVHKLAFGSADGILGIVSADGNIELRDGKNGQLLKSIASGVKDPRYVVIDPDGNRVITLSLTGNDYSLTIKDTRSDRESVVPSALI